MDRISGLSDDVLVKILSYLPTKVAVSTSILSKRWDFLWMYLPKLDYSTRSQSEYEKLRCFLSKTLPLHRAPVIQSFHLDLRLFQPKDVKSWVEVAVTRQLRELEIRYKPGYCKKDLEFPFKPLSRKKELLPRSFYACKSLEILKLDGEIALYIPRMASLPSLKILQLKQVNGESLRPLLSICPFLEKLSVVFCYGEGRVNISVIAPSLHSLSVCSEDDPEELEIDTPSLKYLKLNIKKTNKCSIRNMPKLEEAYLDVNFSAIDCLFGSITSVKRLTLCGSKAVYSCSFVFNKLENLKLCDCRPTSGYVLARLLKDSPNLRVLDIFQKEGHRRSQMLFWNVPSTVPKCFLSTLQIFNWSGYIGRQTDRDVVVYILKNAWRLKTATISSRKDSLPENFQMLKELSRSSRASTTCELIFD